MDTLLNILIRAHSGLRWIALLLLVVAIVNALMKKKSGAYTASDKKINLFAMIMLHIQLLIGLVLYAISSKVNFEFMFQSSMNRFYGLEHAFGMLLGIILATVAYSKSKRDDNPTRQHRTVFVGYFFALILIVASIPWPFRNLGAGWF